VVLVDAEDVNTRHTKPISESSGGNERRIRLQPIAMPYRMFPLYVLGWDLTSPKENNSGLLSKGVGAVPFGVHVTRVTRRTHCVPSAVVCDC
jgi:hypothetical protein